jgi:formate dehydrogenase major subunit
MLNYFDPSRHSQSDWEKDFGTPKINAEKMISLSIDGQFITVPEGTSVMRAAAELGITVPKLCATDSLDAFGSCRLCMVEIEGVKGKPAACTTPVSDSMAVITQS